MDAFGRLKILGSNKGIATVYIAVMLVVLIAITGLAIDLGYMYVAKGQLQNAADSAALAGAAKLPSQTDARTEAVKFAAKNNTAGSSVIISSISSVNDLTPGNDITFGNWSPNLTPKYLRGGAPPGRPINAVEVRARRTDASDPGGASSGGRIETFLGKALDQPIFSGWSRMGASAAAIAQRPPRGGAYFMIGRSVCDTTGSLTLAPQNGNMAWTTLNPTVTSTSASDLRDNYFCPDEMPDVEVCGQTLFTSNGTDNVIFQSAEVDFYDPNYDAAHKEYSVDDSGNRFVSRWTVIVPVASTDNPTLQPNPVPVWGYAKITITSACGPGDSSPCSGRPFTAPSGICAGSEKDIVISAIECSPCGGSMRGNKSSLVQ